MDAPRNKYTRVHLSILTRVLRKRKISFKKLLNWCSCNIAYLLKRKKSGKSPFMLSIELWNECNANCLFCRDKKGGIYDLNPEAGGEKIIKGKMNSDVVIDIIDQVKDRILIAVLYTNGEPLIYKDLPLVIKFASDHKVATMIASNGLLLDEKRGKGILDAGLDFIKIQLSGFTQDIYSVQIRNGNVEKLKDNIRNFVRWNKEGRYGTVILVDFIHYNYNHHQLPQVREFCKELGVMLNIRPGNPSGGLEKIEPPLSLEPLPLKTSCDWLWKSMQFNWNGDILQCCEGAVFSNAEVYEKFTPGKTSIMDVWNGPAAVAMREKMTYQGRGAIPICAKCRRTGISFKW